MTSRRTRLHHQMWRRLHICKDRWWRLWLRHRHRDRRRFGRRLELKLGRVRWSAKGGRKARVGFGVRHAYPQEVLVVVHDGDAEPTATVVARDATS